MPVNLYYTQHVRGFQQERVKYSLRKEEITLRRTVQHCPKCGATEVTEEFQGIRDVRGEPLGNCREVHLRYPFIDCIVIIAIDGKWDIYRFCPIRRRR